MSEENPDSLDYLSQVDKMNRITHAIDYLMHVDSFQKGLTGFQVDKQVEEIDRQINKRFRIMCGLDAEITELREKKKELLNQ